MTQYISRDWIELLQSLVAYRVDFLIVGATALAYHGHPRYTGDLDLYFDPSIDNAPRLLQALQEFGAPVSEVRASDLAEPGLTLTFGVPPSRVDLLNWLSGVDWNDAASDAVDGEFGGVPCRYISKRAYVKNKQAAGRPQDIADIAALED